MCIRDSSCSPHILQSMDRELFEKYIYDIPGREEIIQAFLGYCDRQRAFLQEKHAYIGFFTREGIDYFCRTGRFRQTPSSIYALSLIHIFLPDAQPSGTGPERALCR